MERAELEREHCRAAAIAATIDGQTIMLVPKVFSSGSLGWYGQGKVFVGDSRCQVGINVTVIGSKPVTTGDRAQPTQSKPPVLVPGEQNGPMPKQALDAPPASSPLFGDQNPSKPRRKRS